jgi:Concanavalin A-like lectin/glucanases superfamily
MLAASLCAAVAFAACGSSPGAVTPALPAEVPGLQLWLDASRGILDDPLALWSDQSGHGRDFRSSGTTPPSRGTGLNGRASLDFDGAVTSMSGATLGSLVARSEWTVLVAFRAVGSAPDAVDAWLDPPIIAEPRGFWGVFASTQHFWGYSWDVRENVSGVGSSTGVSAYGYAQYDGSLLRVSLNGSPAVAVPCGDLTASALDSPVMLGAGFPTSAPFRGSLGDVAVWNRALTTEELERLELFLSQKYGL